MSNPDPVFAQMPNPKDVLCWIESKLRFGKQALFLSDIDSPAEAPASIDTLAILAAAYAITGDT
jgi:hypothetical protein